MTKEEILGKYGYYETTPFNDEITYSASLLKAMELYAQEFHRDKMEKVREKVSAEIDKSFTDDYSKGFNKGIESVLEILNTKEE